MNEQQIINLLVGFGYKPQEIKIYLACLQLGLIPVSAIAIKAGIQRTEAYLILEKLHNQGVVSMVEQNGKMNYSAISLEKLKNLQIDKIKKFESAIPELRLLEKVAGRPKVQFFEGAEGIKVAINDTLNMPKDSEFVAYFNEEGFYQEDKEFANRYVANRTKRGIRVRCLAPDTPAIRERVKHDKEQLRTTRLLPADKYPFTNEFDIYGNKVQITSISGELLAVIIESESIAKTQKMIFELAWLGAERYLKK